MKATIKWVNPESRESHSEQYGTTVWLSGTFEDGSEWSVGTKPENVASRTAELESLVGKEEEFELGARPEYNGRTQWKLMNWPGKPSGGGGKHQMSPSERAEIRAEVALKAAVMLFQGADVAQRAFALEKNQRLVGEPPPSKVADILEVANEFYEWISKFSAGAPASSLSPSGSAGGTSSPPPRAQNPPATTSGPNEGQPEDGGGATAVGTGEGSAAAPPSLQPGEVLGKPCPDCGCEVWKEAPMKGWSICTACGTAEKTKEVTLP